MGKPHKHAELIKAWANGAEIQYKTDDDPGWYSINDESPAWVEYVKYRIKPITIKYRLYLWDNSKNKYVFTCQRDEEEAEIEQCSFFVRWLGDWQEVEV